MIDEPIVFLDKNINEVDVHVRVDVGDTYCRMYMVDLCDMETVALNLTELDIDVLIKSLESSKDLIQARTQFNNNGGSQ